jgi:two-component system sensor histidine kinase KdpD
MRPAQTGGEGQRGAAGSARRTGVGRLTLFFGAGSGAEARHAMLRAARDLRRQQVDVVIGPMTADSDAEALIGALGRLAGRDDEGDALGALDLDAALQRRPGVLAVDDLWRTNPAHARHPRRWQDVDELLRSGIDVLATLDVRHLESLNDIVFTITGTRVADTVPDRLFDDAHEIVFVDVAPGTAAVGAEGLRAGPTAAAAPDSPDTLQRLALREIALRRVAERIDDALRIRRRDPIGGESVDPVWNVNDALLVCVGKDSGDEKVVRAAGLRARRSQAPWHAVYVETPVLQRLPEALRRRVLATLKLAASLGAVTATVAADAVAPAIVGYAREHNLGTVVLGRSSRPHSQGRLRRRLAEQVADAGPEIELMVIRRDVQEGNAAAEVVSEDTGSEPNWPGYAWAFAASMAVSLATLPMVDHHHAANIVMLYLLAEVVVSIRFGRGPALASALLNVLAFDYFFVPPRFSFEVNDFEYVPTFVIMMIVGLLVGQLTSSMRFQARVARYRERRARSLYEMASELGRALSLGQIAEVCKRTVEATFRARSALLVPDANGALKALSTGIAGEPGIDPGLAHWAYHHAEAAGTGTDTSPSSGQLYVPLDAATGNGGVLVIEPASSRLMMIPEQRQLLDTFAALTAGAIERLKLVTAAQEAQLAIESERLRNSLLAALSHDLRTPLTSIIGMSEVLGRALVQEGSSQVRQALAITEQSLRSAALVKNLLDMARLQAGAMTLRREWQSLEELAESAIRSVEGALRGHPLRLTLPEELPLLHGDGVLLERVLANLFENAAKYTPEGTPITLAAWKDDHDIFVEVSDDGPGLPSGDSDLFQKFSRGTKESSIPGVGLGLAICQAIVRAHGGEIEACNRLPPAHGAVFTWSIPYRAAPTLREMAIDAHGAEVAVGSASA